MLLWVFLFNQHMGVEELQTGSKFNIKSKDRFVMKLKLPAMETFTGGENSLSPAEKEKTAGYCYNLTCTGKHAGKSPFHSFQRHRMWYVWGTVQIHLLRRCGNYCWLVIKLFCAMVWVLFICLLSLLPFADHTKCSTNEKLAMSWDCVFKF